MKVSQDALETKREKTTKNSVEDEFRRAQTAFTYWYDLPAGSSGPPAQSCGTLDFDLFRLCWTRMTIARVRGKHIETF